MLTSFFSKSKPINFLAVLLFLTVFYILANLKLVFNNFQLPVLLVKLGVLLCFLTGVWVLNFIAKKNELTKRSAFKIIIFAAFSVSFPEILRDNQVIVANLFVLLALRRIISLRSHKEVQKKIFDATFWICIASLFYFWSILFVVIVYSGILLHTGGYFKNWLIPPVAVFAVFAIATSFDIVVYDTFYTYEDWYQESLYNFSEYQDPSLFIPLSIILALAVWTLFYYFGLMQKASITSRPTYILVLLTLAVSIGIAILSPEKDGSELLFFFVPLAIIASNYFERKSERIFKEILLLVLILMPILIPVIF